MKVCDNCGKVVLNRVEICPSCDGKRFTELLVSSYNDYEPYVEEKND